MPAPEDPAREALELAFMQRWTELCRLAYSRYQGDWRKALDLSDADKPLAQETTNKAKEVDGIPTVSKAFEEWSTYQETLGGKVKTVATFGATITRFIQLFGDLQVQQIKRKHIQDFMLALLKVPTQGDGIRKLTIQQAIEKGEAENLPTATYGTVKNQLRALGAVLQHAKTTHEGIPEEPVTASGVIKDLSKRITRNPTRFADEKGYSRQNLKAIFTSPLFTTGWKPPRADYGKALYWLPLIMAYTGTRREEIAKLHTYDIAKDTDTGIWHFRIQTEGEETVKTTTSQRKVPIHEDLIALGLLKYVDKLPRSSRLFPKLTHSKDGWGHSVGKAWAQYLRNVVKLNTKADPSHGFRHTFKTLCREVEIPKEVSDWITGHAAINVGDTYGINPLSRMSAEMKKLPSVAKETGLLPKTTD